MRIQSINSFNGYVNKMNYVQQLKNNSDSKISPKVSFGAPGDELFGGAVGTGICGWGAFFALCSGPIGWLAGITIAAASVGGAVIGGKIAEKI